MPDMAMCPSTVCAVRKECMRNWDSKALTPDRDPKVQKWVPLGRADIGVGYEEGASERDCSMYKPLLPFPAVSFLDCN